MAKQKHPLQLEYNELKRQIKVAENRRKRICDELDKLEMRILETSNNMEDRHLRARRLRLKDELEELAPLINEKQTRMNKINFKGKHKQRELR